MVKKKRIPEENACREKICQLLQIANISSMDDIQSLFKETIAEFMENGLEAELDGEFGYNKYDYKNKAVMVTAAKICELALEMSRYRCPVLERANLNRGY